MKLQNRWAGIFPACFFSFVLLSVAACNVAPATPALQASPTPPSNPAPTETPAPPPGVFWVDSTRDLGEISPYSLGMNHGPWSDFSPFSLDKAVELGATFLRWPGGSWGDQNDIQTYYIDTYMGEARKIGAEPSITVRLTGSTPEKAAGLLHFVNVERGYKVKYWSIGNEPDLYSDRDESWNPQSYARRWREFALAMKAVDPSIVLYGPDISDFVGDVGVMDAREYNKKGESKRDYLVEFLKLNADLVNIVAVHHYPFPKKSSDSLPSWQELRDNTVEWDRVIPNLRRIVKETTGQDYPVGILEYNSDASNAAGASTSPDSFYNALWVADIYGRMIRQRPEMLAYWLIKNNTAGHGLLGSYDARPTYYPFVMWKKFGNHLFDAGSDTKYVSVYAAKTGDGTVTVMLVNLNDGEVRKPLQINGGDSLGLAETVLFDANHKAETIPSAQFQNGGEIVLPAESVTLLIFH
jgi:hypothetical protein